MTSSGTYTVPRPATWRAQGDRARLSLNCLSVLATFFLFSSLSPSPPTSKSALKLSKILQRYTPCANENASATITDLVITGYLTTRLANWSTAMSLNVGIAQATFTKAKNGRATVPLHSPTTLARASPKSATCSTNYALNVLLRLPAVAGPNSNATVSPRGESSSSIGSARGSRNGINTCTNTMLKSQGAKIEKTMILSVQNLFPPLLIGCLTPLFAAPAPVVLNFN